MNKTRVDDMLIEMIAPKIEEINKKFSNGDKLTQDDINTLLLKSQYNHINHLDDKLNEVTASVVNLEYRFDKLEVEVKADYKELEQKLTGDMKSLEQKLTGDMKSLEQKLTGDMKSLEQDLKSDMKNLKQEFKYLEVTVTKTLSEFKTEIELNIQKALNKNMMLLVIVIGFFMTLSKVIDKF